jgi:hypothetical protein
MVSIETVHKEIKELREDVAQIKKLLREDFELSDEAKSSLLKARKTPESKYVDLI